LIVTISRVATPDEYAVGPVEKSLQDVHHIYRP
jgi:hypothetical protein